MTARYTHQELLAISQDKGPLFDGNARQALVWAAQTLDAADAAVKESQAEIERLREALEQINQWAEAYPLSVFPEPDFAMAHSALQSVGMTLDAISASNMRHVLTGVKKIVSTALENKHD